jgi:hypothetical protein
VPVAGGPAVPICKVKTTVVGAAWLADGTIALGVVGGPLQRVPEAGGTPEPLTALDTAAQETDHLWPSEVPGTSLLLFVVNQAGNTPLASQWPSSIERTAASSASVSWAFSPGISRPGTSCTPCRTVRFGRFASIQRP